MFKQIKKRDGRIVDFDPEKITNAIFKAANAVSGKDRLTAEKLTKQVVEAVEKDLKENEIPTVEQIQDTIEKILVETGHYKTAKAYILYREKRAELRRAKAMLGVEDDLKLPLNSIVVLEKRYLKKDDNGRVIETPRQMFERVARTIAEAERSYKKSDQEIREIEKEFLDMMVNLEFLPNSPTLMNAGTGSGLNLSACFVLPVEDSIEKIFESVKQMAIIQKAGGGTGFSFSRLRPSGDTVKSTSGIASGPISFMQAFDAATEVIKQGGKRRGANMGIMRVDHPDILDFIVCKEKEGILKNFNISVAVTDKFMNAVERDKDFELINPKNKRPLKTLRARAIWNLILTMAWKNGEPGIIFIDTINKFNPTPQIGEIESTNPCGEQPLLPYESCNLGSINLSKFVTEGKIDWEKLKKIVRLSVRFLDNVIDANNYPIAQIDEMTKQNRKIGFGVMGFAEMLIQLGIPYNSNDGIKTAEQVMKFITEEGRNMSEELGKEKGSFQNFKGSALDKKYEEMRNATVTTIAPAGTISVIGNCSSGIEPLFAVAYIRDVSESIGMKLVEINPLFEAAAIKEGFYNDDLIKNISGRTSIQELKDVPKEIKEVFTTAHDISPEWHVKMQAAFQKYVDNAVSKTLNFPNSATPNDIEKVYMLAYKSGCKGITVYRSGSREIEILKPIGGDQAIDGCTNCNL